MVNKDSEVLIMYIVKYFISDDAPVYNLVFKLNLMIAI